MTAGRTRRGGFTLIELLVVIGIITLLASIATGAYFQVVKGQKRQATEATLSKIDALIRARRDAIVQQVANDNDVLTTTYLSAIMSNDPSVGTGNKPLARSILAYLRLKNEFPTSTAEAGDVVYTLGAVTVLKLPGRVVFTHLPRDASNNPLGTPEQQSAMCLYLSLTATGSGGVSSDLEGLQGQVGTLQFSNVQAGTTASPPTFTDAYGQPITFSRLTFDPELNSPPYPSAPTYRAFDPTNQLPGYANLSTFWTVVTTNHIASGIGAGAASYPPQTNAPPPPGSTAPYDWTMTAASAGPNGQFGPTLFDTGDAGIDNLLSFRLRKQGQRGD